MTSAKKEKESNDDHLPRGDDFCPIHGLGDHALCWDTDLDLSDFVPQVELHDAALRVEREAA